MKILVIGRKDLGGMLAEDYELYKTFLLLGAEAYFEEYPLKNIAYDNLDWVVICKTIGKEEQILELKQQFPTAKMAYWGPDYQMIADTESSFQKMVGHLDLFIGLVIKPQPWFEENKVPYFHWIGCVAWDVWQKEEDITVTTLHAQTPYPNEVPIGFCGNWAHNPWRSNILREFQYQFGDGVLHVNGVTVREFTERDDLRNVHYPLFGHWFNCLIAITKISLSMESMGNFGYWGGRTVQTMAAGGFVLMWHVPTVEDYYGPSGENLVYFYNTQDGIDKARYYLEHEDERKAIAERGNKFVNKNFRPLKRVKLLYEDLYLRRGAR